MRKKYKTRIKTERPRNKEFRYIIKDGKIIGGIIGDYQEDNIVDKRIITIIQNNKLTPIRYHGYAYLDKSVAENRRRKYSHVKYEWD